MIDEHDAPNESTDASVPTDGAPADGRIASGILAAEGKARTDIDRRRRLLVGGAVLGLVIVGAVLAVVTVLQQQANTQAREAAERADARAELASQIVGAAEDYELAAVSVEADAMRLSDALTELLLATDRTDTIITSEAEAAATRLGVTAETITALTDREVPEPGPLVAQEAAVTALRDLETLRAEAVALADEITVAERDATRWREAVLAVNTAVADHVEQVESEPTTSDPALLIEVWEAERPALVTLSTEAALAAQVPGLEAWAAAHVDYAEDTIAWIEEAVALLESLDVDTYNERFDEEFGVTDPFGFSAAVAAATDGALGAPALQQLAALEARATLVLDAIDETERTVAEVLAQDAA